MRLLFSFSLALMLAIATASARAEDFSAAGVTEFIQNNMIGKQLRTETTRSIDNGKVAVDFATNTAYTNFTETPNGFEYDVVSDVKQTNYDLDAQGKKKLPGVSKDRIAVTRYSFNKLKSTGKLLGMTKSISNTLKSDSAAGPTALQMGMQDGKLVMKSRTVYYSDRFAAGNQVKPGASETTTVFEVKDGKLHVTSKTQTFDVDPVTMARTPDGDVRVTELVEK
ncbi:MAG: hypothetical protein K8T91_16750 [Planctomycetes bacterium]|nr:hypothetical protein [Planctomycetota bacterium]